MPSPFGEDSDLCRMLRVLAPRFEHRLFLSAAPHNGHTRSFTGLLEMLDPVRFTRTSEMTPAMRGRVEDVVVRRLKRDINARSAAPRFCTRHPPQALALAADPREIRLSEAFDAFRTAVRALVSAGSTSRRRAGAFAVEILGKRLLSCPAAFAESWRRARQGFASQEAAPEKELAAAERVVRQETGDDREAQERQATAATVVGAWLRNFVADVGDEIRDIERALEALGFDLDGAPITEQTPAADARFDALVALIERLLRRNAETRGEGARTAGGEGARTADGGGGGFVPGPGERLSSEDLVHAERLAGRAPDQIDAAVAFAAQFMQHPAYARPARNSAPPYDLDVVDEAVVNAVAQPSLARRPARHRCQGESQPDSAARPAHRAANRRGTKNMW